MNIFGVGPMEMGIIAVAALLIFGPGKLPEVMGQAGRAVRDFRRMTAELTGEFEKTIAEAQDIGKTVTGEVGAMKSEVASVTESVKRDLGGTTSGTKGKSGPAATSTKTGKTGTTAGANKTLETGKKSPVVGRRSTTSSAGSTAPTPRTHANTGATVSEPIVVASKDDPWSDLSLFNPEPTRRERRVRRAGPAAISTNGNGSANGRADHLVPEQSSDGRSTASDDPLSRARQRRLAAGYNRRGA